LATVEIGDDLEVVSEQLERTCREYARYSGRYWYVLEGIDTGGASAGVMRHRVDLSITRERGSIFQQLAVAEDGVDALLTELEILRGENDALRRRIASPAIPGLASATRGESATSEFAMRHRCLACEPGRD
jgi:hypothetical protein